LAIAQAQIPSFGGCPDYEPMANFDKERFLGRWYEAERYFTVSEVGTKCVSVDYERRADGKVWVNNAYTSRITNVQRIVSGVVNGALKGPESLINVKYTSFPVNYDTTLRVLDTDYDSFAVIYSCSRIGPIGHTESAWLFTREREAAGPIMQRAYGVLDRYKISRTFFVKSDQNNCETLAAPTEVEQTKNLDEPIPALEEKPEVPVAVEPMAIVPEVKADTIDEVKADESVPEKPEQEVNPKIIV